MFTVIRSDTFRKWISKLKDQKAKALILLRVSRLEEGNFGKHAYLRDKISELKIDIGPGYRVYYTQKGEEVILLISAGNKRSQKRDINKAIKILTELEKKNERKV